ncbi:MAG TPA: sigma factor-like helix-turn-helix DNA-binding protein [Kofleriaceae bacterium]|nr:sigma factor-like helix-turn-helix DNA-binding protein [Kofleriaceae bacterium]
MDDTDLVARAYAERPAAWVDAAAFLAHVAAVAVDPDGAPIDHAALHAGDLYLACAAARGVPDALATLEREHLSRLREFAASVDSTPAFVDELAQQLRHRILVADGDRPPRIASYSGRGSLGGWIRVAAVRLARDISRSERAEQKRREDLDPGAIDPELGYLKQAYGVAVSTAVQDALAALDGEARALLRMHYVDGLTIDQVGTAFGKSRATSARMLAAARMTLLDDIRRRLVGIVGIRTDEADSLVAFVRSRLEVSLARALR